MAVGMDVCGSGNGVFDVGCFRLCPSCRTTKLSRGPGPNWRIYGFHLSGCTGLRSTWLFPEWNHPELFFSDPVSGLTSRSAFLYPTSRGKRNPYLDLILME